MEASCHERKTSLQSDEKVLRYTAHALVPALFQHVGAFSFGNSVDSSRSHEHHRLFALALCDRKRESGCSRNSFLTLCDSLRIVNVPKMGAVSGLAATTVQAEFWCWSRKGRSASARPLSAPATRCVHRPRSPPTAPAGGGFFYAVNQRERAKFPSTCRCYARLCLRPADLIQLCNVRCDRLWVQRRRPTCPLQCGHR
jgi:hypothetical protein